MHEGAAAPGLLLGHRVTGMARLSASERASRMSERKAEICASMALEPTMWENWGTATAARMAVIATTTSNSIKVTPRTVPLTPGVCAGGNGWWVRWLMVKVW